jgi:HEAT repeat protein
MAILHSGPRLDSNGPPNRLLQLAHELAESSSRDEAHVAGATARLTALAPDAAELAILLSDRNPFVRSGAARWMRHLSNLPREAVDALRAAIYDQNPYVVQAALGSAAILKLESVRDDAHVCLEDSNPCVIHAAIFALGKLGPAEEGERLVRFLDSEEQHLQVAAVTALAQLGYQPAGPALLRRLEAICQLLGKHRSQLNLATRFLNALVALEYREAIPTLIRIAREEVGLRGLAVQALIELRAAEAAPALVPLLQQLQESCHEEKLCCRLLYLMTTVDYRFAMPLVRSFLNHRQPGIRCAAIKAVTAWKDREAIPLIREIARDDVSAFVRPVAVAALVDLGEAEVLADLERFATDSNALVRSATAEGLGRLLARVPEARPLLTQMIGDETLAVARVAQEALLKQPETEAASAAVESTGSALPACLREQAPAARAYLQRWRSERPPEPIASALATLLDALE